MWPVQNARFIFARDKIKMRVRSWKHGTWLLCPIRFLKLFHLPTFPNKWVLDPIFLKFFYSKWSSLTCWKIYNKRNKERIRKEEWKKIKKTKKMENVWKKEKRKKEKRKKKRKVWKKEKTKKQTKCDKKEKRKRKSRKKKEIKEMRERKRKEDLE